MLSWCILVANYEPIQAAIATFTDMKMLDIGIMQDLNYSLEKDGHG